MTTFSRQLRRQQEVQTQRKDCQTQDQDLVLVLLDKGLALVMAWNQEQAQGNLHVELVLSHQGSRASSMRSRGKNWTSEKRNTKLVLR